jgi:2,4-diaminopentanoate dehydrogenase
VRRRPRAEQAATAETTVPVVVVGIGGIGQLALEQALRDQSLTVVGAVDPAREGEILAGVPVAGRLDSRHAPAQVALVATGSALADVAGLVEDAVERRLHVVSTCEELTYPWVRSSAVASRLDAVARRHGVAVVGTGVNPGFVMDILPAVIATASCDVSSVRVVRRVDVGARRPQLRQKLGIGADLDLWNEARGTARYGHVGLVESAHLCALAIRRDVTHVDFVREPVTAGATVRGVRERAVAQLEGGGSVELELVFALGCADSDEVVVVGSPGIHIRVEGGVHGDSATVARLLHAALYVSRLEPGLRLPLELPLWAAPAL